MKKKKRRKRKMKEIAGKYRETFGK